VSDLAALPRIRDAALFGAGLHLVVEDEEAGMNAVREALGKKGIPIQSLEAVTPSMEDLFISLIEAVNRDELVKNHHMTAKKNVRVQGVANPEE
jgi:ABC-2 type transport system ATP-binding protein